MNEATGQQNKPIQVKTDAGFVQWVAESGGSIAISTYQAGMMFMVGWLGNQLSMLQRHFDKPMGFDVSGDRMVIATRNDVISLQNNPVLAHHYFHDQPGRYDALYLPRMSWHTADMNLHDIALSDNDIWVVNTRFSCLATLDHEFNFYTKWQPSFITDMAPEDRCHLNGLAMKDNIPAYVTALGETDVAGGWRDNKANGGIVIDVENNEIIQRGLSMPHSPRWYNDTLWLLNSGKGQLLKMDVGTGKVKVVCEMQGYLRGLSFVDKYALVGLCKIRETNVFGGMPVQDKYERLICGIAIVDTETGDTIGMLEFTEGCTEIFDLRFLSGIQRPNILNLEKEQARQAVTAPQDVHYWLHEENVIKE